MNRWGLVMSCFFVTLASQANTNDVLNVASHLATTQQSLISQEQLKAMSQASTMSTVQNAPLIEQILNASGKHLASHAQKGQTIDGAVLFVSFSMPESLLFALADEASHYHIPVVIKGLVDGDFKKTIETFAQLRNKAKQLNYALNGVSIDPLWFEQFQITAVPALVVSHRSSHCGQQLLCKDQPFDVVYGNASIKKSLELIAEKGGTAATVSRTILEKGCV